MSFKEKLKNNMAKIRLILILGIAFIAIITILLLMLFAGKKTYTVTFDLNGGVLISGDVEQRVIQGQSATPPTVAKYGHYLLRWSGDYKSITRDVTIKAIWEYETSPGIQYSVPSNTNYCEVSGSYPDIQGDVFIGSYYNNRPVMGIKSSAFKDRIGIRSVYMLDGILTIDSEAFSGCTSLEYIDIPSTVIRIGASAFKNCTSLKEIIIPASIKYIDGSAFEGCTALEKVTFVEVLPEVDEEGNLDESRAKYSALESIGAKAFYGCSALLEITLPMHTKSVGKNAFNTPDMTVNVYYPKAELPEGFVSGWFGYGVTAIFDILGEPEAEKNETKDILIWPGIVKPGINIEDIFDKFPTNRPSIDTDLEIGEKEPGLDIEIGDKTPSIDIEIGDKETDDKNPELDEETEDKETEKEESEEKNPGLNVEGGGKRPGIGIEINDKRPGFDFTHGEESEGEESEGEESEGTNP